MSPIVNGGGGGDDDGGGKGASEEGAAEVATVVEIKTGSLLEGGTGRLTRLTVGTSLYTLVVGAPVVIAARDGTEGSGWLDESALLVVVEVVVETASPLAVDTEPTAVVGFWTLADASVDTTDTVAALACSVSVAMGCTITAVVVVVLGAEIGAGTGFGDGVIVRMDINCVPRKLNS